MSYKAKNVDTDKVLKAIEDDRILFERQKAFEIHGINKYYEGIQKGLAMARGYFECSIFEKDSETQ